MRRNQHTRNAEQTGAGTGVDWPGSTERNEYELARIEPPVNGDELDLVGHVFVGRFDDGVRRGFHLRSGTRAELPANLLQRRDGRNRVKSDLPAQEIVRVEAAQHEVGVSCRGLGSTLAIAHRAWIGSGTTWTNLEQTALVDPGDAASARPERSDIDAGDRDGDAEPDLELRPLDDLTDIELERRWQPDQRLPP